MIYKRILVLCAAVAVSAIMLLGLWTGAIASSPPTPLSQPALTELLPGHDYINWYVNNVRPAATAPTAYFGAYKFEPVDDLLYLGYGSGRPAETAGSLLAVSNGSVITPLADLDEEGFIDITAVNGTLFIPGPDPHYGDGWELGNFYVKEPGQPITKYRNLPNVIHAWGAWYDIDDDVLYAAVSSHLGDSKTWTGEVFRSDDRAVSWTRVATKTSGVGNYRTYDITGFNDKLYLIWDDDSWQCGLAVSADQGLSWTRLTTATQQLVACRNRLHIWDGKLLALSRDQKSIIAIDENDALTVHPLHDYQITSWSYNALANAADGYLYAVAEHGQIIRTNNLTTWQLMARTGLDFFSVAYWPHHDWLIVGERGNGRVWKLDLADAKPISPAPPTAQYIILMVADGWGANHIAAAANYSGQFPPYQTWPRYWMTTYANGGGYDPTWTDLNYLNLGATDSAAAATALYTGRKTTSGFISVDPDGNRLTTISERAQAIGKAAGAVSSVYLSHATPGAWMGHNDSRLNGFAIADEGLWGNPNTTGNITTHIRYGGGHGPTLPPQDVIIAAGHPGWNGSTYVNAAMRNKLAAESGDPGAFTFVERLAGSADGGARLLTAANLVTTTRLAGLFGGAGGNLEYRLANGSGHNAENPTLAQMTTAALTVLARNPEGFALMVEGGAVDWASHSNNMNQMVGEMLAFNEAVQAVVDWVEADNGSSWDNTLVIVTGDHETGYLTAGPGVSPHFSIGSVTADRINKEKVISGTLRRASWDDKNNDSVIDPGEAVYWAWNSGQHTNMLVPLYARGAGASRAAAYAQLVDPRWGAYLDNTAIFEMMDLALRQTEVITIPIGESVAVGDLDFLFAPGGDIASLEVITFTVSHPQATHAGLQTDVYWRLRGLNGSGQPAVNFTATLTVTVPFTPGQNDLLCRYANPGWECGQDARGSNWIAQHGITQFSDWTVGRNVGVTAVTLSAFSANASLPLLVGALVGLLVGGTAVVRRRKNSEQ
jgi:alkaline phosphatase